MVIEYLTAILVFVTTIYVYLTHQLAKASEASVKAVTAQSEAMLRPYIIFEPFVRPNTPFMYLRIKNIGKTAAQNVSLTIDRDFFQFAEMDKNLKDAIAFNTVIDSFAPDSEILFGLGQGWVLFGDKADHNKTPNQFSISAKYSYSGKEVVERNYIDLRPFVGSEGAKDPVVEELEKIRKVIEKIKA
jgi:hypothetical protein